MLYKIHNSWRTLRESSIIVLEDPQRMLYKVMEDLQRMLNKNYYHSSCRFLRGYSIKSQLLEVPQRIFYKSFHGGSSEEAL